MNLKKWTALLLSLLTAFAVAGCNGDNPVTDQPIDIGPATATPAPTETPAPSLAQAATPIGMVAAGSVHSVGLRADGTAISAGHDTVGQRRVSGWTDLIYIAAGEKVTAGVRADGTLVLAGDNTALADEASWNAASAWTGLHSVAVGGSHIAGLKADGTVVAAGNTEDGQCDVTGWSGIVAIAAGDNFTVGLKPDGTLVTAGAAPDVSAWTDVIAISAGGDKLAALTATGTALASGGADVFSWNGLSAIAAGGYGVVGVKADGTVVAALADAASGVSAETDVVSAAVGAQHVVLMHRDGTAAAYGVNDDLQCAVDRFFLRPYREGADAGEGASSYLIGFRPGMTVADATPILQALTASDTAYFAKADGTAAAETDLIATGLSAYSAQDVLYSTVVLMGDVDGDGAIGEADAQAVMDFVEGGGQLEEHAMRAARASADSDWNKIAQITATVNGEDRKLYTNTASNQAVAGAAVIRAYAEGTGTIAQYGDWHRSSVTEGYETSYAANNETVGYIKIDGTNIDYPIMFRTSDRWYYNDHTFEQEKAASGSLYPYYFGYDKNNVVTGHNSRPSGTMFHELHHIQEFNLGETACLNPKNCTDALVDLPDLNVYANRVWTVNLYGVEARYEIFSMYETQAPADIDDDWYSNVWWADHWRDTDEEVQEWVDKQLGLTEIEFDTPVSAEDTFLTVFTCATHSDDADENARLFYFLKRVD